MATPQRLILVLEHFEFARERLTSRMAGPKGDSGDGVNVEIVAMSDDEYLWEPVPNCSLPSPPPPIIGAPR